MEKHESQTRSGKKKLQEDETPKPDLNKPAKSIITKETAEPEKWGKRVMGVIFVLLLLAMLGRLEFLTEKLSGKVFSTSVEIVNLLRLEVILIVLAIGSRWGKIKETVYQSLMWQNGVGLLRYGAASLSIAFLIFAWAAGGFVPTMFGTPSALITAQQIDYFVQIYNFVQLSLFFGLSTIGGTLLAIVNWIEAGYDFTHENSKFLYPYKYIDAEILAQLKNEFGLDHRDFSKPIYVLGWNVKSEEKIIEIQIGNLLGKEDDGQIVTDKQSKEKLGKWVLYKVNVDFKGRILSLQRYEIDDYQKIR